MNNVIDMLAWKARRVDVPRIPDKEISTHYQPECWEALGIAEKVDRIKSSASRINELMEELRNDKK